MRRWHTGANAEEGPTRLLVIDIVETGHSNTVLRKSQQASPTRSLAGTKNLCIDAATRLTIACPPIPRGSDGSAPAVSVADIMGMIGEYRLASTAVDIEALELAQRGRRITARRSSACPSIIRRRAALLCLRNVTRSRA